MPRVKLYRVTRSLCPSTTIQVDGVWYTVAERVAKELRRLKRLTRGRGKTQGAFEIYKGTATDRQRFRWKATARNGRRVADGADAYVNEAAAVAGALLTAHIIAEANGYQLVQKG